MINFTNFYLFLFLTLLLGLAVYYRKNILISLIRFTKHIQLALESRLNAEVLANEAATEEMRCTYWICLRMVKTKSTQKYMTRIGQYTGISNACQKVQDRAIIVARVEDSLKELSALYAARVALRVHLPELPFGQTADEGPELVVPRRG